MFAPQVLMVAFPEPDPRIRRHPASMPVCRGWVGEGPGVRKKDSISKHEQLTEKKQISFSWVWREMNGSKIGD